MPALGLVARSHDGWSGPAFEGHKCSLGYEVIDWLRENVCHGPGDLQGEHPIHLDGEMEDFIIEAYRLDERTGRKVFDEGVLSRPKGRAKTEIAGWLVCAEAYGPVRFSHWDVDGQPVGKPVKSPLIKCLATEESQATAAFSVVAYIVSDWGQEHRPEIYGGAAGVRQYQSATSIYLPQGGEIRAATSGAASKDGGKETFVVADESHLYVLAELKKMYATVRRNLGKRKLAEPWLLQTSTAYRPGEMSVFEETLTSWRKGSLAPTVLVDHREAKGKVDLDDVDHTMAQLRYVYGAASAWMDLDRIFREMIDPRSCPDWATAARYYLNRPMSSKDVWIPKHVVERQVDVEIAEPTDRPGFWRLFKGAGVCLGFDGSLNEDSTALIGCRMSDGFLFPVGIWEKPDGMEGMGWEVPRADVLAAIREAFGYYDVVRLYGDPHEWRTDLDDLATDLGPERVIPWATTRDVQMAAALGRLHTDLLNKVAWHAGDPLMSEHLTNAYVRMKGRLRLVRKENESSPRKIDSTVGAALAYEARADALNAGWKPAEPTKRSRIIVLR